MVSRRRKPWEGLLQPSCHRRNSVRRPQPRTMVTLMPRPRRKGQPLPAKRPRNACPRSKRVPKVDHLRYRAAFPAGRTTTQQWLTGRTDAMDFTQTVKRLREPVATAAGTGGPSPYTVAVPESKKSKVAVKPRVPPDNRRRKDSL
ncbi:unnamed protein product [Ixodes persulcatus]